MGESPDESAFAPLETKRAAYFNTGTVWFGCIF